MATKKPKHAKDRPMPELDAIDNWKFHCRRCEQEGAIILEVALHEEGVKQMREIVREAARTPSTDPEYQLALYFDKGGNGGKGLWVAVWKDGREVNCNNLHEALGCVIDGWTRESP